MLERGDSPPESVDVEMRGGARRHGRGKESDARRRFHAAPGTSLQSVEVPVHRAEGTLTQLVFERLEPARPFLRRRTGALPALAGKGPFEEPGDRGGNDAERR